LRREISPGGKSRAFINDTPVTLDVIKNLGQQLMDIHSQHETLSLSNQSYQLQLIDSFAGNQNEHAAYAESWTGFLEAKRLYEDLVREADSLKQEADYIKFQLDELDKASLEVGEQEKLEDELKIMDHAEDIKTRFNTILELLNRSDYASRNSIAEAKSLLKHIAPLSGKYEVLFKRVESLLIELDDILGEIKNEDENVEFEPARLQLIKDRIDLIYTLQKKHRVNSLTDLQKIHEDLARKADVTSNLDASLQKYKLQLEGAESDLHQKATTLTSTRKKVLEGLTTEIIKLLHELGIPNASIVIDHQIVDPSINGADKIEILFSANKGIAPQALAQVASGGEFSRLMFCIKFIMAEKTAMPTLILDEIDSGVSGEIAIKLGGLMKRMAGNHQLIAISHLPQIAGRADTHYYVYKDSRADKTISNIKRLSEEERVEEIAKMIGGDTPSKVAFENAKELLVRQY
jgi:DNA repair protein RecN (Recombination protein N)